MSNCIFCKIINGEIPSYKVYEDENVLAFLDIAQTTKGHTLVVPKKHFANFAECDDEYLTQVVHVAKKIANAALDGLEAKGVNILSNVNEAAGQTVLHFHVHVIPRYDDNDTIKVVFANNKDRYQNEMDAIVRKIKDKLK